MELDCSLNWKSLGDLRVLGGHLMSRIMIDEVNNDHGEDCEKFGKRKVVVWKVVYLWRSFYLQVLYLCRSFYLIPLVSRDIERLVGNIKKFISKNCKGEFLEAIASLVVTFSLTHSLTHSVTIFKMLPFFYNLILSNPF